MNQLFTGSYPSGSILQNTGASTYQPPVLTGGTAESGTGTLATNLVGRVTYAFDVNYNPAKRNNQMDVFLMNDGTILSLIHI